MYLSVFLFRARRSNVFLFLHKTISFDNNNGYRNNAFWGEGGGRVFVRRRQCVSACLSSDDDHNCCYYRYLIRTGVAFASHGNLPVAHRKARPRTTVSPRHPGVLYRPCTCTRARSKGREIINEIRPTSARSTRPANFRNRPRSWLPRSRSEGYGENVENHNSHTYTGTPLADLFFDANRVGYRNNYCFVPSPPTPRSPPLPRPYLSDSPINHSYARVGGNHGNYYEQSP